MQYTVYALLSEVKPVIYVGLTKDLDKRLKMHNSGNTNWSKRYRPWKLIYSEGAVDRKIARNLEKKLKSGSGKERLKKYAGIV